MLRWRIAILISVAIAISYLDRQAFPTAIKAIREEIPISNTLKAGLDTAFLATYGLMYLCGGRLVDFLGTRRGFLLTMIFWSIACASHGLAFQLPFDHWLGVAGGVTFLVISRLALGIGEGGGFPAATRAVTEWFPVKERSVAMGIINAGTAIGAIVAPVLILLVVIPYFTWLPGVAAWRWVFFLTGGLGLIWTLWWYFDYQPPEKHRRLGAEERTTLASVLDNPTAPPQAKIKYLDLLRHHETWVIVLAKFLTDAAWYFYLFWLPTYLFDARGLNYRETGSINWIPPAASGIGCLLGGALSSWLLARGQSVNVSRKVALGVSAAFMPFVMFVPFVSVPWVIVIFSLAFFGQQSWSTLVMILPTDLFPKRAVGSVAGMVGFGGAMGGIVLGQLAGYLLDHGFSYIPVLIIAGSLHVTAFVLILVGVRRIRPLLEPAPSHGFEVVVPAKVPT